MKQQLLVYLKGLGLSCLALLIFAAVGWINISAPIPWGHITIPLIMASIIWTTMYAIGYVFWLFLIMLSGCPMGLGYLIGVGALGYVTMRLAIYVLPAGWVTFNENHIVLFLIGATIALIHLIIDEEKRNKVSSTSSSKQR